MADLSKGTRAVNLLVTTYDRFDQRSSADGLTVREVDAQVDYRDPQGHTQTNPHLISRLGPAQDGRAGQYTTGSNYSVSQMEAIRATAGDRVQHLRDTDGRSVGSVYAVKADVIPHESGQGYVIDTDSLQRSDFTVEPTTRMNQFENMRWARSPEGASVVEADRGSETYLRESQAQAFSNTDGRDGLSMDIERAQHYTTLTGPEVHANNGRPGWFPPVQLETGRDWELRTQEQLRLMPDLDHSQPIGSQPPAPPARHGLAADAQARMQARMAAHQDSSSQAGLAGLRDWGYQSTQADYPGAPEPPRTGSWAEPWSADPEKGDPELIESRDVPLDPEDRAKAAKARRATTRKMAIEGVKGGVAGAQIGARAGSIVPGAGTAVGTAAGAGLGAGAAAINAKRAAEVDHTSDATEEEPSTPPVGRRIRDVMQSDGFKAGARRVGVEAVRDASARAAQAHASGAATKGVAASAAAGAASGAARALRESFGADMAGRLGNAAEKGDQVVADEPQDTRRSVTDRHDRDTESSYDAEGDEPELGM